MIHVQILGTRGIPSQHGGFETFAQDLSLFLHEQGHRVTVYCQASSCEARREDHWRGVRRIHIPAGSGAVGTMEFDWKCVVHSCREEGLALTLGYNTAVFSLLYRLRGHKNLMNMDGLEWKRDKWSLAAKAWLRLNEWLGSKFAHHLIADHPLIAEHLYRHTRAAKISIIPYGSLVPDKLDSGLLEQFGLTPDGYYLVIARPEPENSILEIVEGFSARQRETQLVVLGTYLPEQNAYHAAVLEQAGPGVRFLGPIYDRAVVGALRRHAKAYIHGHRVGGTNPSLVESMAAGNAIIAHDNPFTRWVSGEAGIYFQSAEDVDAILNRIDSSDEVLSALSLAARMRHQHHFSQTSVLASYEKLLQRFAGMEPTATAVSAIAD